MSLKTKYFFSIIIISSICLVFFFYFKKSTIKVSTCFNQQDKEIIILNNQKHYLDSLITGPSSQFFFQIRDKIAFDSAFISLHKPRFLFTFKHELTKEESLSFLKSLQLKVSFKNNTINLGNHWKCKYDNKFLFFYKGKFNSDDSKIVIKKSQANFSVYNTMQGVNSQYFIVGSNVKKIYENKLNTSFLNKNDFELFRKIIPVGIKNYSFFEKKYAEHKLIIDKGSSFHKMINSGFCVFKFRGKQFIVAEIKKNCDPYKILDFESGIREIIPGLRKKYENLFLTVETPSLNNFFYLDYFENKLVFSENKEQFEDLISFVSEKKSNLLNIKDFQELTDYQPKDVIFRKCNPDKKVCTHSNGNLFKEYISSKSITSTLKSKTVLNSDKIKYLINGLKYFYVFTSNEIIKINSDKLIEKVNIKGEIIGKPEIIKVENQENLFFTTTQKIYFLNENFKAIDGFPIVLKNKPLLPFVFTNYKPNNIIGFSESKFLSICDSKGNNIERLKLNLDLVVRPISFFKSDDLYGVIHDEKSAQFINLDKKQALNKIDLLKDNTVFITNDLDQAFYYIENNKLIRNDFNGDLTVCASGYKLYNLKSFPKRNVVGVLSDKNIAFFDVAGKCISKIKIPKASIHDFEIVLDRDGNTFIIMLDTLSNEIYIYTFDGESVLSSPIKGSSIISINGVDEDLQIITFVKNKLIKYFK
jgi:hypothetical protein